MAISGHQISLSLPTLTCWCAMLACWLVAASGAPCCLVRFLLHTQPVPSEALRHATRSMP